jgi:hypothetical protein
MADEDWFGQHPEETVMNGNTDARYTVAIVVDVVFADISAVADRLPTWIVETPHNRSVAEQYWREHPALSNAEGVTTFKVDSTKSPEDWCADILSDIDLHHGFYSHDPPYFAVEVFGVPLSERLRSAFGEFGSTLFQERSNGFRATLL